ncbi:MAG: hypothetical protein PVI91_10030 [Gammaproteobacteria bacterium]|jgi:hypothetical protein
MYIMNMESGEFHPRDEPVHPERSMAEPRGAGAAPALVQPQLRVATATEPAAVATPTGIDIRGLIRSLQD